MDYFDLNLELSKEDISIKMAAREFARKVMRPISIELDKMPAEEAFANGSPFWEFMKKAYELDFHKILIPEYYGGEGLSPLQTHLVYEEFGWASFGLAVELYVTAMPFVLMVMNGDENLIDTFVRPFCECRDASMTGCWAITEPEHGSDHVAPAEEFFSTEVCKGNVQARIDGDEWVINGQKSSWVSGATVATHAVLHAQIDPSKGFAGNGVFIVPLDRKGISKGKPLEKIGQRDLNQGELFFDNVRIPKEWIMVDPDFYIPMFDIILSYPNMCMATWATGLARAAYEECLTYTKQRVQGGTLLKNHYSMKQRIFKQFARTESNRMISREVMDANFNISPPHVEYAIVAKTTCCENAYQNAHDAIQIWGGNGLTKEYIVEKLFRDARATLIEDGNNECLEAHGGHVVYETYPRRPE